MKQIRVSKPLAVDLVQFKDGSCLQECCVMLTDTVLISTQDPELLEVRMDPIAEVQYMNGVSNISDEGIIAACDIWRTLFY